MSFYLLFKVLFSRKVVTGLLLLQLAMTLALLLNSILLAKQTHQQLNQPTGLDVDNTLLVQLKPTMASLRVYPALEELPEADWTTMSQRDLAPVRAGRFIIHTADHADAVLLDEAGEPLGKVVRLQGIVGPPLHQLGQAGSGRRT